MKTKLVVGILGLVSTLLTTNPALAQEGKTREQVKAELDEAIRTGDIYIGDSSFKANEICPSCYPAKPATVGKSREQVRAELAAAIESGDNIIVGDQGLSLRELYPSQYPAVAIGSGKTREEVRAEFLEAQEHGDLVVSFAGKPEREILFGFAEQGRVNALCAPMQAQRKNRADTYAELVSARSVAICESAKMD